MDALTPEKLIAIADAAVKAPSADNCHVFRLQVEKNRIAVIGTPAFLEAPPHRRLLGLISLGAMVANLEIRSKSIGLALIPEWRIEEGCSSETLCLLEWRPSGSEFDPLDAAIDTRQTNRALRFRGPRLADEARRELSRECDAQPDTKLFWFDKPERRKRALRLVRIAETERFRRQPLHEELFGSIRFDVDWATPVEEGLPPGSLSLPTFERGPFRMLRHWRIQRLMNGALGAHHFIGLRAAYLPCRLTPHLCAIGTGIKGDMGAIHVGRALQRVWLRAALRGMALQVFAAPALYAVAEVPGVSSSVRSTLRIGWTDLCPDSPPLIVFRLGWAPLPSVRAGRPPAETIIARTASASRPGAK